MRILTLCGSLRHQSSNRAILQAYEKLSPESITYTHYDQADSLPHFNPDLDHDPLPEEVFTLREEVAAADALLISTPEYVHALPGSFKNILDWLVSDISFAGKPVIILHVDKGSSFALDSLKEVLRTMSARVLEGPSVLIPLQSNQTDAAAILKREDICRLFSKSSRALANSINL